MVDRIDFPEFNVPEHYPMPVNEAGDGPEIDTAKIAGTICWCGDLLCARYRTGVGESMSRIPPAARQLIMEVAAYDPDVHAEGTGEPDGFGLTRSIRFTRSEWLADTLDALIDDRIESVVKENQASTLVTFVPDARADFASLFEIKLIADIITGSADDEADAEPEQQQRQENGDEDDEGEAESEASQSRE